jgi:DegV family protein with EDD domain
MKLGLVTDSTCDLPAFLAESHGIEVVPAILVVEGREYADGQGMSRLEFYDRLPAMRRPPTTAAPSIGAFAERYERLLQHGCDHVLSIHAAEALSTIMNSARQAATSFEGRVSVVDGLSLSLGLGFQVLAAAEAAEGGLAAALQAAVSTRAHLHVFAALDTMEYVRRSGRVPAAVSVLGGLLSIKPLFELADGEIKTIGAVRTTQQADLRMLKFAREAGSMQRLAVLHTGAEARARAFLKELMEQARQLVPRDVLLVNVTPVIGAHVGPNGLGFAAVRSP